MEFNCLDKKTGEIHFVHMNDVYYLYKGDKYKLMVHSTFPKDLEWELMSGIDSAARYLGQFGFIRLDTNFIANRIKITGKSEKKIFGKHEAYFDDKSSVTVSKSAYDLYLKD